MNENGDQYTWDNYGSLQVHLVGCYAAAWVLICLISIKGLKFYGKAAYVITLSPYFVLTVLFGKVNAFELVLFNDFKTPETNFTSPART